MEDRTSYLWSACQHNDFRYVEKLLSSVKNIDINFKHGPEGTTPLIEACKVANVWIVESLLRRGADTNIADTMNGSTPLHTACTKQTFQIVQLLIENGADVNLKTDAGRTCCHIAVCDNLYKILELLLDNKADVDVKNKRGNTPLHWAALYGWTDIVHLLLNRGAKLNDVNKKDETPYDVAQRNGKIDVANILQNWKPVNSQHYEPLKLTSKEASDSAPNEKRVCSEVLKLASKGKCYEHFEEVQNTILNMTDKTSKPNGNILSDNIYKQGVEIQKRLQNFWCPLSQIKCHIYNLEFMPELNQKLCEVLDIRDNGCSCDVCKGICFKCKPKKEKDINSKFLDIEIWLDKLMRDVLGDEEVNAYVIKLNLRSLTWRLPTIWDADFHITYLYSQEVLTSREKQDLDAAKTSHNKITALLDILLNSKHPKNWTSVFLDSLKLDETSNWLFEDLQKPIIITST